MQALLASTSAPMAGNVQPTARAPQALCTVAVSWGLQVKIDLCWIFGLCVAWIHVHCRLGGKGPGLCSAEAV